ncbi:hypothetical protein HXX76_014496 [Chlamydomonas incerta]|uniref:Nucleotide-diphospho-sugar transferase domain-containing protein n=1 Tax=Chlamydomonas incerta TaxID=51695 RepID=A0A835SJ67_CHLIN|nr:hypothetical protein HXX76_014496 [Chlamydomonas incerta]|eukprot:KAG2424443.1 hypothetical protein HXX76_014496 [Chlamydomonas incerta]
MSLWLLLVCLAAVAHRSVAAKHAHDMHLHQHYLSLKVCERRGGGAYCSWMQTKGYMGPLDSAAAIKEALAATEYKKEVILFSEDRMPEATQSLARFRNAGYSHIIGILPELAECHRLAHIFAPWAHEHGPLQCGTYATRDPATGRPYPVGFPFLARGIGMTVWWRKWYTAARAVALGYNVLALDSDNLVLGDLYWRVKAPESPLSEINLFTQAECGDCVNSGFVYIQNAAPNGPIAWMLYDMVQKVVRWAEDPSGIFDLSPKAKAANWIWSDDQESMSDVLYSAITGKPRFFILAHNLNMHKDPEAFAKLGVANGDELMKNVKPPKDKWNFKKYDLAGKPLAAVVCDDLPDLERCHREVATSTRLMTAELHMPHSGGQWPGSLGGYPFNKTLGPITLAYRQSFKDLGVPLPPDPEDPATEAAARATPKEMYGLVHVRPSVEGGEYPAGWLESTWYRTGRHGLWHTHLLQHEFQSFAHIHASLFPGDFQKQLVMQAAGIYDWRVGARLAGGAAKPYYAYDPSENLAQPEMRRVVAYLDGVVGPWLTKKEVVQAASGLAQIAVALGAAVAWPAVDCSSDWVQLRPGMTGYSALMRTSSSGGANTSSTNTSATPGAAAAPVMRHSIPWTYLDTSFQTVPFGQSLEALKCMWPGFTWRDCLTSRRPHRPPVGRGLTPVEFEHLVQHSERQLAAEHGDWWASRQRLREAQPWLPRFGPVLRLAKDGPAATPLAAAPASAPPPAPGAALLHAVQYGELLELNAEALLQGGVGAGGGGAGGGGPEPPVPVLWVDRLVGGVAGLRGEAADLYGNWTKACRGLHYYDIPERDRTNW